MFCKFKRASSRSSLSAFSKSSLTEALEVPPGPLEGCLAELSDFDRLLHVAETCRQEVAEALAKFRAAVTPLLDSVRKFNFRQLGCDDAIAQLCVQLDRCTGHLQDSEACSHTMHQRIEQARSQSVQTHKTLQERKELWATKLRCEEEAAGIMRRGSSLSMEQKSARLKAKHEAEEAFQSGTARALSALEDCLTDACPAVQLILTELVCVYSALPTPIEHLISDAGRTDTAPCPAAGLELKSSKSGPPLPPPVANTASIKTKLPLPVASTISIKTKESLNPTSELTCSSEDFSQGEAIQVWSASQNAWLDGHVERVYHQPCKEETFTVPIGVVKVTSAAGVKYVRSEHVATTLRKMAAKAG